MSSRERQSLLYAIGAIALAFFLMFVEPVGLLPCLALMVLLPDTIVNMRDESRIRKALKKFKSDMMEAHL